MNQSLPPDGQQPAVAPVNLRHPGQRSDQPSGRERRESVRYALTVPAYCMPILNSCEVDPNRQVDGVVTDVSQNGMCLRLSDQRSEAGDRLLVAVGEDYANPRFIAVEVCNVDHDRQSTTCYCTFQTPLQNLFAAAIVNPVLDRDVMKYQLPYPNTVLRSLASVGAITELLLDRVLVCPDCRALPTVRRGCCVCLGSQVEQSRMIHHYACAHVDFVDRFQSGDEISCPKCLSRKLIVGADFEYLDGPSQCLDCGHSDLELAEIGHCLNCEYRFDMQSALDEELIGYRVNRLDVLDLIDTA